MKTYRFIARVYGVGYQCECEADNDVSPLEAIAEIQARGGAIMASKFNIGSIKERVLIPIAHICEWSLVGQIITHKGGSTSIQVVQWDYADE